MLLLSLAVSSARKKAVPSAACSPVPVGSELGEATEAAEIVRRDCDPLCRCIARHGVRRRPPCDLATAGGRLVRRISRVRRASPSSACLRTPLTLNLRIGGRGTRPVVLTFGRPDVPGQPAFPLAVPANPPTRQRRACTPAMKPDRAREAARLETRQRGARARPQGAVSPSGSSATASADYAPVAGRTRLPLRNGAVADYGWSAFAAFHGALGGDARTPLQLRGRRSGPCWRRRPSRPARARRGSGSRSSGRRPKVRVEGGL